MAVLMLGAGLQATILGLRATLEGFPTPVTGLVMSCYYVGYLLGTQIAPRAAAGRARAGLRGSRRAGLRREPGACLLGASAPLGADAPRVRGVLRRDLCGRRELAQSPREPHQSRAPARHLHAGPVRRARGGAVPAGAHEPRVAGPLHAEIGRAHV